MLFMVRYEQSGAVSERRKIAAVPSNNIVHGPYRQGDLRLVRRDGRSAHPLGQHCSWSDRQPAHLGVGAHDGGIVGGRRLEAAPR